MLDRKNSRNQISYFRLDHMLHSINYSIHEILPMIAGGKKGENYLQTKISGYKVVNFTLHDKYIAIRTNNIRSIHV